MNATTMTNEKPTSAKLCRHCLHQKPSRFSLFHFFRCLLWPRYQWLGEMDNGFGLVPYLCHSRDLRGRSVIAASLKGGHHLLMLSHSRMGKSHTGCGGFRSDCSGEWFGASGDYVDTIDGRKQDEDGKTHRRCYTIIFDGDTRSGIGYYSTIKSILIHLDQR